MNYESYLQLEKSENTKGRKMLITAYFFLLISLIFFAVFFIYTPELPVIGCAFLCDGAALVYLMRSVNRTCPFRQMILARKFTAAPSEEALYKLCASLESPGKPYKYGKSAAAFFAEAAAACESSNLPCEDKFLLSEKLRSHANIKSEI